MQENLISYTPSSLKTAIAKIAEQISDPQLSNNCKSINHIHHIILHTNEILHSFQTSFNTAEQIDQVYTKRGYLIINRVYI